MAIKKLLLICGIFAALPASADVVKVAAEDFTANANLITFSEIGLGTINPIYSPELYGGADGDPTVSFGGYFLGQSLSDDASNDCPGAAATACIIGNPTGPLALDPDAPVTSVVNDSANPTAPVLSGTPTFNGGVALLFSEDQFAVGFDGGFFDAVASTAITAFDRNGTLLGSVSNEATGIEFLGLAVASGANGIAGVFLDLVGSEPAGFAIDNVRFGQSDDVVVGPPVSVNEPAMSALFVILIAGLVRLKRR